MRLFMSRKLFLLCTPRWFLIIKCPSAPLYCFPDAPLHPNPDPHGCPSSGNQGSCVIELMALCYSHCCVIAMLTYSSMPTPPTRLKVPSGQGLGIIFHLEGKSLSSNHLLCSTFIPPILIKWFKCELPSSYISYPPWKSERSKWSLTQEGQSASNV